MRHLPSPFDRLAAGLPTYVRERGTALLGQRLLTKDLAFPPDERLALNLQGLLPARVLTIGEQVDLELEHLRRKDDPLERYIGLAALQDRNATLFYRLLAEHLEEFLPVVYTPTVGRACQEFSHILRRTRGVWITPHDIDRIPDLLRNSPYEDVRLIVVTDNERILGLGDQGAGGMAIPVGKLALYTGAGGIHPALTLPVSLDVGTDNAELLADPLYVGYRGRRLRGVEYDALVEAFVAAVERELPGCVIQWEDFKQANALRILDRYRDRVPSFNDDVEGTAAVVLGGLLAVTGHRGTRLADERILIVGAGAAGIGIARLLDLAVRDDPTGGHGVIALVDSRGLVHDGRTDLDPAKRHFAVSARDLTGGADASGSPSGGVPALFDAVRAIRPTVLVGATGVGGTFDEASIRTLDELAERPIVLPLSNPTSASEATPGDVLRWTAGRALVATGSPFLPVATADGERVVGQANNVFIFPGVGLGAVVAEVSAITDGMFLAAAHALAGHVTAERFAAGGLYPPVAELRAVARSVAVAVAREAVSAGVAGIGLDGEPEVAVEAAVDAAIWWPAYVPYLSSRP
ncbi:MAG TPA: oxaloacetate-decarboxylating malate dehydrogenase [Candidatus Saccharimonadales bacterium]|nr:oxaloacetate-decarboxylating malate dehydrogenase [Candidatus Saccharimonadales bacterium]